MNKRQTIYLDSDWHLAKYPAGAPDGTLQTDGLEWIAATVPGAVQYDLMAIGELENPYASTKNAFASAWVAKSDWLYRVTFNVENITVDGQWILNVSGVDTFAEIWLGDILLGEVQNNYRSYDFKVSGTDLKEKENILYIRVKSHERMMKGVDKAKEILDRDDGVEGQQGKSLIRRYQRSFFTNSSLLNIGTGVLGIGINRPVTLSYYPSARIVDCFFRTTSVSDELAEGEIHIDIDAADSDAEFFVSALISDLGNDVVSFSAKTTGGKTVFHVKIRNPELWWPAGYGKPKLYDLHVCVEENGACLDGVNQKIGLRTVELEQKMPSSRNTFQIKINGKPIYVRGQNFIPLDYIKVYGSEENYERLFKLLTNANTNLIRIWGGGMPESEAFLSMCDNLGILVWQDFFLHSNVYPDYDPEFLDEVLTESEGIVTSVRRHACLCMLCGGNEQLEGWEEWGWSFDMDRFYGRVVLDKLQNLANQLCPDLPYVDNSPHGGRYAQSPTKGDCHNWGSYFNAFKDPLFVTETCWTHESYSRPETLAKFMNIDVDEYSGKGWFDKFSARTSLQPQNRQPYSNWFNRKDLRSYLMSMEIEQARADYSALSIFRLRSSSNRGIVYWSFNKGGPLFQFGCVDYGGYPMMSYYVVRRLYEPIVAGVYRDVDDIHVMVSNESGCLLEGYVELLHMDANGNEITRVQSSICVEDGCRIRPISLPDGYRDVIDRSREVFVTCLRDSDGNVVSEDVLYVCPFSEFRQERVGIKAELSASGDMLTLSCDTLVQMVALESNQKILCSDNYFPLIPGVSKMIKIDVIEKTCSDSAVLHINSHTDSNIQELISLPL